MSLKKWYAYLLNPLINLPILFWIDPTYDNLSYIGNQLGHFFYLMLWALSSVFGLYFFSKQIWQQERISYNPIVHALICLGMPVSCLIPYSTSLPGWVNDLHIWLAIASVSLFIFEWVKTSFMPQYTTDRSYHRFLDRLLIVFGICFCSFAVFGHINGLCEMSFSVLVNILLAQHLR